MADELEVTEVSFRKLPGARFAGALRQGSRLVWACEHSHGWQGGAKSCADGTADGWPGRSRTLNGPGRVPSYQLPRLPDIRKAQESSS